MTTRKTATRKIKAVEQAIDHDGHDIVEEVVESNIPQTYQCTVFARNGGPQNPPDVVGHIQYSDSTGLLRAIPNPKYDSDLLNLINGGILVKGNPDVHFSKNTKAWILNLHKAELPRNWTVEEARGSNEI